MFRITKAQEEEALRWEKEAEQRRKLGLADVVSSSNDEFEEDDEDEDGNPRMSRQFSRASSRRILSSSDTRPGSSAKAQRGDAHSMHSFGRDSVRTGGRKVVSEGEK